MSDLTETCPSLCVERSHPGREHDPATDGCYCWELCGMGPTCPGANAGLPRGCWRTLPTEPMVTPSADLVCSKCGLWYGPGLPHKCVTPLPIEHHPKCYQNTGIPDDLPDDLCDCGVWRLIATAALVNAPAEDETTETEEQQP